MMEFSLILLVLPIYFKLTSCLNCFECVPERKYDGSSMCKDFDGSDKFVTDCLHSTMCYKRETILDLNDGMTSTSIKRGCAPQTIDGNQAKINGKWQHIDTIYEVYQEGCQMDYDPERPTKTVDCYCRGHLCNGSTNNFINSNILIFSFLIFVINHHIVS